MYLKEFYPFLSIWRILNDYIWSQLPQNQLTPYKKFVSSKYSHVLAV